MIPAAHRHYMPVLKMKDAEKRAMSQIPVEIAARVTPLFEVVKRTDKALDKHLDTAFKRFDLAIGPFNGYYLDCREIAADGSAAAEEVFARAAALGKPFVPVTSVSRSADVAAALSRCTHGLALRLSFEELKDGVLPTAIPAFLSAHGLQPADVDLIVDLGAIDSQLVVPAIVDRTEQFLDDVPHITAWRSFILSGCGFPRTLAGVKADSSGAFERVDWQHWRDHVFAARATAPRLPTYSDCAIQHRDGVEDIDFAKVKPSAAIRQTRATDWHVEKGKNIRDHGGAQFQHLAANVIASDS